MTKNSGASTPALDVPAYLNRIGYRAQVWPNLVTLKGLQMAHLLTVPFENLDIYFGREIALDKTAWFHKIVTEGRGGFCYECNGLFAALLKALGFSVTLLSAQVRTPNGMYNPEFDHMVVLVEMKKRWLVDVGFGEAFREPLCLENREEQVQRSGTYRLLENEGVWQYEALQKDESWQPIYRFSLRPRRLKEFTEMCRFHQTSPKSIFTKGALCSQATMLGRMTLTNKMFTITEHDVKTEQAVPDETTFRSLLEQHFHIHLDREERSK